MQCRHDSRFAGFSIVLVLSLAGGAGSAASSRTQSIARGVVVEEVARNSAGDKAGIKPGDVLLSWVRAAAPPANPDEARGEIASPFDLAEIEIEQAPRGALTLVGSRDDGDFSVVVPAGAWAITVRPRLAQPTLSAYRRGQELIAAGEWNQGIGAWRDLAEEASRVNDWELAAWLFVTAGDTLASARRWNEAHAEYQTAIARVEERDELGTLVRMWIAEAVAFERQNDFPKADAAYREALRIGEKIPGESLTVAAAWYKLGNLFRTRGNLTAAEDAFKRSLVIREKLAPRSLEVSTSVYGLGAITLSRGDLAGAEAAMRRALVLAEDQAPDSIEVAMSLNALGFVAQERADLDGAEGFYRRSLAIRERLAPDSLDVAQTLTNLGALAVDRGDRAKAAELHERALRIRANLAPDSLLVASSLEGLGIVASGRGNRAAAEEFYRRVLAIRMKLAPDSLGVATSLNNLGVLAKVRGDLAAAEDLYRRSLEIKAKLAPEPPAGARGRRRRGAGRARRGRGR